MDENIMTLDKKINQLQLEIASIIIESVRKKNISLNEKSEIASYVLFKTSRITHDEQILPFLKVLSKQWNMFDHLCKRELRKNEDIKYSDENINKIRGQFASLLQNVKK